MRNAKQCTSPLDSFNLGALCYDKEDLSLLGEHREKQGFSLRTKTLT